MARIGTALIAIGSPVTAVTAVTAEDSGDAAFHAAGTRIAIDRAEAMLDGNVVHVRLWTKPVDSPATLTLHLPPLGWADGKEVPSFFRRLKLELDGSDGKVKRSLTAHAGPRDIAADLGAAHLDALAAAAPGAAVKATGDAAERLKAAGALVASGKGFFPRWTVEGDLVMRLDPHRPHRIDLTYVAHPDEAMIARNDLIKAVQWSDYCLSDESAVRLTNQIVPGDVRKARRYAIPVGIDADHPDSVQFRVRPPKEVKAFYTYCGYRGRSAINPPDAVAAGVPADGRIKLIVLSVPAGDAAGSPAPVPTPSNASSPLGDRYQRGLDLLRQGKKDEARAEFARLAQERPRDKRAASLLRQIDADPQQLYGPDSFAYLVRDGDTLESLARRYLHDAANFYGLARYNHMDVPGDLQPGQTLLIPGRPRAPERVTAPVRPRPASGIPQAPAERPKPTAPVKAADVPKPAVPAPAPPPRPPAPAKLNEAQRLRRQGLEQMSAGSIDNAVKLLSQAASLDPGNEAIVADLARARRIQAAVRAK